MSELRVTSSTKLPPQSGQRTGCETSPQSPTQELHTKPLDAPTWGVPRFVWAGIGLVFAGIGTIGAFVPVLPSTVFFLIALWCFTRSSRRLEAWLLSCPYIGRHLADWQAEPGMTRPLKVRVSCIIAVSVTVSALLLEGAIGPILVIALGLIGISVVMWWVPTRSR